LRVVIRISGSFSTKSLVETSFVTSSVIEIYLHSKSPKARVTANRPRTLPNTIYPPWDFILSYSSFLDAFWSTDISSACPFRANTARASPRFIQIN
jgi:hypothetical protein